MPELHLLDPEIRSSLTYFWRRQRFCLCVFLFEILLLFIICASSRKKRFLLYCLLPLGPVLLMLLLCAKTSPWFSMQASAAVEMEMLIGPEGARGQHMRLCVLSVSLSRVFMLIYCILFVSFKLLLLCCRYSGLRRWLTCLLCFITAVLIPLMLVVLWPFEFLINKLTTY